MVQITSEENVGAKAVLTAPLCLDSDSNYRPPNIMHRLMSLLGNVTLGSDLTRFQLPAQFNLPKSQLQCYGEGLYCIGSDYDLLSKCEEEENPMDRFVTVVAWSISMLRPLPFGVAPYNPILGETHHISTPKLNVILEQVSHHPPVMALHATNNKENIEVIWCQSPLPKFYGTHVETDMQGKQHMKLLHKNETYTMNSPNLVIRFLPMPRVDWLGNVRIVCHQTGLEAELCYPGNSFMATQRLVKGKIFLSSTNETLYKINGHWDRTVTAKNLRTGEKRIIYDAKEALHGLKTPIVRDPKVVSENESSVVWGGVSQAIMQKRWDKAKEAKVMVEERQREVARERKSRDEKWSPKYFNVSHSKETGWNCSPVQKLVPSAPIFVHHHQKSNTLT